MESHTTQKGFTILELVIAIAIIGLLTTIVIANVQQARYKARDGSRQASLTQLELALEVYRQAYGSYPLSCNGSDTWAGEDDCADYISGISSITQLPGDPNDPSSGFRYISDGSSFRIENNNVEGEDVGPPHDFAACDATACGSESLCDATGSVYDNETTRRTYAVWGGTTYQCTQ